MDTDAIYGIIVALGNTGIKMTNRSGGMESMVTKSEMAGQSQERISKDSHLL